MRRLQQSDPASWNRAAEQELSDPDFIPDPGNEVAHPFGQLPNAEAIAPPQRKSTYQYQLDSVLGRSGAAAKFLHEDCQSGFTPASRPARVTWCAPSPGCRALVARDAAVAASPAGRQILSLIAREERSAWFDSLKSRLGKPVTPAEAQKPKQKAQPHTIDAGGGDLKSYFASLKSRLGKL